MTEYRLIEVITQFLSGNEWWQVSTIAVFILSAVVLMSTAALMKAFALLEKARDFWKTTSDTTPKDYTPQVYMDVGISEQLRPIKHDTHADRVTVYQFKNGDKSIVNNPFLKLIPTYESLSNGTIPSMLLGRGRGGITTMASILGPWGKRIFDSESIACPKVTDLADDPAMLPMKQYLDYYGVKSVYIYPMKRPDGKIFGFGTVEYLTKEHELDEKFHQWCGEEFLLISGYLVGGAVVDG